MILSKNLVGLFWAVVFVSTAVASTYLLDVAFEKYRSVLGGSYDTYRGLVSWSHIAVGVIVAIALGWFKSPYGKLAPPPRGSAETATNVKTSRTAVVHKRGKSGSSSNSSSLSLEEFKELPAWVAWMVQESPTLIATFYFAVSSGGASIRANPALLLFAMHYVNRTLLFPLFLGSGSPVRAWVCFSALGYCIFNGILQNAVEPTASAAPAQLGNPLLALFGAGLFAIAMYANIAVDKYLVDMKRRYQRYVIPRHWIFNTLQISCPNFFCEFLEWVGFAVCTAGCCGIYSSRTLAAASFALFTAANTFPRGVQSHRYYLEKFGEKEYGSLNRKAVIPYIL